MNELTQTKTPAAVLPFTFTPRLAKRPVLLLQDGPSADRASREWAVAFAAGLRAELVEGELGLSPGQRSELDETQWLAPVLRSFDPQLVVIPAESTRLAANASRLAGSSGVPCLVARPRHARSTVLAATSLEDERHPVLQEGARLAEALGLPLTVVHNSEAQVVGAGRGEVLLQRRLEVVGAELDAEVVVTRAPDPVSGILGEARREDADLIVVGASSSPEHVGPVGAAVAGLARRSVVIVPLS
jgi:nucleotide-binding universal stress UspA family protein